MTKKELSQLQDILSRLRLKASVCEKHTSVNGWPKEVVSEYKGRTSAYTDSAIFLKEFIEGKYKMSE